jgi:hypothetical protein
LRVRFPDSEIRGSEGARPYSRLIAACYVLHRLCAPRHPPDALALTLDRSAFVPCPEKRPGSRTIRRLSAHAAPFLEWYLCDQIECLMDQPVVRPANPAFTCQRFRIRTDVRSQIVFLSKSKPRSNRIVGALVACHAQLRSSEGWWSRSGSNRRPQACKARALPTELRPRKSSSGGPGTS